MDETFKNILIQELKTPTTRHGTVCAVFSYVESTVGREHNFTLFTLSISPFQQKPFPQSVEIFFTAINFFLRLFLAENNEDIRIKWSNETKRENIEKELYLQEKMHKRNL